MRKWFTMAVAAATLALTACTGTMPDSSRSGSTSGVEIYGTIDAGIGRTW